MKKTQLQLRQPTKFTHQFLKRTEKGKQASEGEQVQTDRPHCPKTKPIQKQKHVRKIIKKPNIPSALRLEQINRTFDNLQSHSADFLASLAIDHQLLQDLVALREKFECDCKRNVKYYCLKCNRHCKLLDLPKIALPLGVHVIHHTSEKINKSSVAPLRFLADSIQYYPFSSNPLEKEEHNKREVFDRLPQSGPATFILYPHKQSKSLKEIGGAVENIILLDCTWFQTDQLIETLQEKGYTNFIKLEGYESVFWRYNHYGEAALSTAESLLYFFREYQHKQNKEAGQYDPLMLLYALSLTLVGNTIPTD